MSVFKIVRFDQQERPALDELHVAVRGHVFPLWLSPTQTMFVNAECLERRFAPNVDASRLAQKPIFGRVALWTKPACSK